jgi:hypothetical protein
MKVTFLFCKTVLTHEKNAEAWAWISGPIDCYAFIFCLQTPSDGSMVDVGVMDLGWNDVSGAAEYGVVISENSNLSDPVVSDTTTMIGKTIG